VVARTLPRRSSTVNTRDGQPRLSVLVAVPKGDLRERVTHALEVDGVAITAHAASVGALLEGGREDSYDVVVFPCDPREDEQLAEVKRLRRTSSAIVLLAPAADGRCVRRALRAGALGLVVESKLAALGPTVRAAALGQISVPGESRAQIEPQPLSYRERQALGMVVMGFSNGEIAARLFLAESTVKSHLSSAFSKLGVRSRAEAAALVLDPAEGVGAGILTIPTAEDGANGHGGRAKRTRAPASSA
jgi:DNA-binding NarL/FixJ family response regulator